MMLPKKRPKFQSNILRGPRRDWPRHRKYVRGFQCCVPGCDQGPIEFAHVRTAANSGKSLKPADWDGISLCHEHHAEQHQHGAVTFEKKYRIDLMKLANEFARQSPDQNMKESMRAKRAEEISNV